MPKVRSRARPVSRSAPPLLSEALTLHGSEGSADLIVNPARAQRARERGRTTLPISVSDNVLATSTLTLELQDQPLQSVFVRRLPAHGAWRIPCPICQRMLRAATAQSSLDRRILSRRQHQPPIADAARERGPGLRAPMRPPLWFTIAALFAQWRQQGPRVRLPRSAEIDQARRRPGWLPTFCAAWEHCRSEARRRPSPPRLPSLLHARSTAERAIDTASPRTSTAAQVEGQWLHVTAPDAQGCEIPVCAGKIRSWQVAAPKAFVSCRPPPQKPALPAQCDGVAEPDAEVFTLHERGYPSGCVVRGEGEHVLSLALGASCVVAGQRVAGLDMVLSVSASPCARSGGQRGRASLPARAGWSTRRCHLLGPNRCGWRRAFPAVERK